MSELKVTKGTPISASKYNRLVDRLPSEAIGQGVGGLGFSQTTVMVKNETGANRDLGEIAILTDFDGPTDNIYETAENLVIKAEEPTWHTEIATIGVFLQPTPVDERGLVAINGMAVVKLKAAPQAEEQYVFIDEATPTQCKSSFSGFGKILSTITINSDQYAIVCIGDSQNLWRYVLLQDSAAPGPTQANLVDRRGANYGVISLLDPLALMSDQKTGDQGWCINCGNEFEAIQAPCG